MASPVDLSGLDDKQLAALQEAINKKTRSKIDWDNMTDQERSMWNKTIEPRTHKTIHFEYPKAMYGKKPDGVVVKAEVTNAMEEEAIKRDDPSIIWKDLLRDHGVETCPSPPDKAKTAGFVTVGVTAPPPAVEPVSTVMVEEHPAAVAARRGRPPGSPNKPKDQAAA